MTLIDNNQVEELLRELLIELLVLLRSGDGLIKSEIDLERGIDSALLVERQGQIDLCPVLPFDCLGVGGEFRHYRTKRAKVVHHRLIDENVAVGEKKDALLAACLPQTPDDLKRRPRLAAPCRHHDQDAIPTFGDGFNGRVDRVDLIIPLLLSTAVVVIILKHDLFGRGVDTLPGAITRPEIGGRREVVEAKICFLDAACAGAVVEQEAVTVRRENEGNLQCLRIIETLLDAVADAVVVVFGLDQCDRDVRLVVKDDVSLLRLSARHQLAANDDPALGEVDLLPNLQHFVPARALDGRQDELRTDIAFGEDPLVHFPLPFNSLSWANYSYPSPRCNASETLWLINW